MAAIALLAVQILAVASMSVKNIPPPVPATTHVNASASTIAPPSHLRGTTHVNASAGTSAPAPASAPTTKPFVDERGARGHFYYSDGCEDCVYKGAQCGCQAAVEYFACLTKHCHNAEHSAFSARCAELSTNCSSELDIACHGPDSSCKGKYHQLPSGGVGLTLDLEGVEDDAFCGPHGKCIGTIHMKANIHNSPPQPPVAPVATGGAAPAPAAAQSLFLECGLPNVPNADVDDQTHWTLCRAAVVGNKAACDLPMFPTLEASEGKEAYCVLTEGTGDIWTGKPPKRLTQPAWHTIINTHEKTVTNTTAQLHAAAGGGGVFGGLIR